MIQETFDYPSYLAVKKSIDDASLDPDTWLALVKWVGQRQGKTNRLQILEVGAGIGIMIERLLESVELFDCTYTAMELEPGFNRVACHRMEQWCQTRNFSFTAENENCWILSDGKENFTINWITADVLDAAEIFSPGFFDLIISHAVIDLLPVPLCMPDLINCIIPGGGFYFSLNYAGETRFLPSLIDDARFMAAYNDDMDKRFPGLDWQPSMTGSRLGHWLSEQGHTLVSEQASDWNLVAGMNPDDDQNLFMGNILDTMGKALSDLPGIESWISERRNQLEAGMLKMHVSNRDVFGIVNRNK